jgi:hypothetical protein
VEAGVDVLNLFSVSNMNLCYRSLEVPLIHIIRQLSPCLDTLGFFYKKLIFKNWFLSL